MVQSSAQQFFNFPLSTFFLSILFLSPLHSAPIPLPTNSVGSSSFLNQADIAYLDRSNLIQAEQALSLYEKAIQENPASIEVYWKASRCAWWVGDERESNDQKSAAFQQGINLAKKALQLDSNCVEAHFWLGANSGSYGEAKGILKSLFFVKPIRHEMETILQINPQFLGGAAYRVLGTVDYKLPSFAGGDKKRALERLNLAMDMDPTNPFNYYYLAEYYETVGYHDKAKDYLTKLQSLQASPDLLPELSLMQKKGQQLSRKIK